METVRFGRIGTVVTSIDGHKERIMQIDQRDAAFSLSGVGLTDEDIYEAMKTLPGYIDITPGDFKELYCIAYKHAMERFARSISAEDIMVKGVLHASPDTVLAEVAEILGSNGISGLPVIDADRRVVGIISEKDILSRLGFKDTASFMAIVAQCLRAGGCVSLPARALTAGEIMTAPAITVRPDTPLLEIVRLLAENGINRLPVTDSEGRLLGILARGDILKASSRSGTCPWNISGR
jgi:CBS-domain-containing membrane protein